MPKLRRVSGGKASNPGRPLKALPKYDFRRGVRRKYAKRYAQGTNLVLLDPDVARVFPDSRSVNQTLRALAGIIHQHSSR